MTAKHTPGPWRAQSRSVSDGALVVKAPSPNFAEICVIRERADRHYGEREQTDQANAALIARAPDLLTENEQLRAANAELVAALEWLMKHDPDGDVGIPDYKELRHVCDTASAALARAKGV